MTGFADKGRIVGALISLAAVILASVSWVARADDLQIMLEEPVDGQFASGVSNIRGWAIGNIVLKVITKFNYFPATTIPSIIIVGEFVEYSKSKSLAKVIF